MAALQRSGNCWWTGGDLRSLDAAATKWVAELRGAGVEPRFVFDGMVPAIKTSTALKRGQENARKIEAVLKEIRIRQGEPPDTSEFALPGGTIQGLWQVLLREGVACVRARYEVICLSLPLLR